MRDDGTIVGSVFRERSQEANTRGGARRAGWASSGVSRWPASAWLLFKFRCESFLINGGNNVWKIRNPRGTP